MKTDQDDTDTVLERISRAIDPRSSVPVAVQLRGALRYGIGTGEVPAGARLPSVRRFASRLGISPVTVSGVFAQLQERGQIEGRVGTGTFVTDTATPGASEVGAQQDLQRRIEELADIGREMGLSSEELSWRVAAAAAMPRQPVRVLMLGSFADATAAYAAALRPYLRRGDEVISATFDTLDRSLDQIRPQVDLIAAPRTILTEASELFPNTPVVGVILIPDEATRIALATLEPGARVTAVSYFDDFLSVMLTGITRLAPHITEIQSAPLGDPEVEALLTGADVLIHSTGASHLREMLNSNQRAIEYRHTPDVHAVRNDLLPAIEIARTREMTKEPPP